METILWIVGFLIVAFICAMIVAAAQGAGNRKLADEAKRQLEARFNFDEIYVSAFDRSCVGLNWNDRRIYSGKAPDDVHAYDFAQLQSSEIEVDGVTITKSDSTTKTNRGSQMAGAAVGGLVFGGAGALVGGLTGGSRTTSTSQDQSYVCSIALSLRFNDRANPIQRVKFWECSPPGVDRHNPLLRTIADTANRLHALMTQVLDENGSTTTVGSVGGHQPDVSERLERLWSLRQSGALTDTEFEKQKKGLLRDY